MIVIADMTGTRFCDSRGLRALVLGHKQVTVHHTELRLVIASANVLRALAITKLDTGAHLPEPGRCAGSSTARGGA
jgi:anti-anti-sigma factor